MRRGLDARPSDVVTTGGRKSLSRVCIRRLLVACWLVAVSQSGCSERGLTPEDFSWATEDLAAVAVLDATVAVVVSRAGSIYRTDDAGETFRRVHADSSAALFDLSMMDEFGWAVGDGRILATRNGGRSWRVQPLPEGREAVQLRGVHALDADHALAVGLAGVRLRTQNAGRLWEDRSEAVRVDVISASATSPRPSTTGASASPLEISFDADLHDVVCDDGSGGHCVSLGAASGVAYSIDRGESWIASRRLSPLPFELIEVPEGSVELSREAADRIAGLVERSGSGSNSSIRVEAFASSREIEGFSRDRDPGALFEILEARGLDAVGILEGAGFDAERIRIRGTPPWGYEELLDDDPGFLARYWRDWRAARPGLRISVIDERPMHSGRFVDSRIGTGAGRGQQLLAVGAGGATWQSLDGGVSWGRAVELGDADLFALAQDGSLLMVGGDQGILRVSADSGEKWKRKPWPEPMTVENSLLDLDFSTDSGLGLIVGNAGLILKRGARGEGWERIVASNP